MEEKLVHILDIINVPLGYVLITLLIAGAVWFSVRTRFVQFRLLPEMLRQLFESNTMADGRHISSFKAFTVSLGTRVGTGNLAGVATAIAIGGPGAIFWMWVMALVGAANAFVESTLAQLFKQPSEQGFIGGPAYYIWKGLHNRWFASLFAVCMILDFGLTNNMVQSNTISLAFTEAFHVSPMVMAVLITALSLLVVFGGIKRIANVCSVVVPFMALAYLGVTIFVIIRCWSQIPDMIMLILRSAMGLEQAAGGTFGTMVLIGFKRGLFSNEAGEGSAPNVAATAVTSHPAKQGLIQTLGVFTDTLVVCTCTALIILCSGLYDSGANGIELTQLALSTHIGAAGKSVIGICILFFAFSSIIGNYYYGECNLMFLFKSKKVLLAYRIVLGILVFLGAVTTLEVVWGLCDLCMALLSIVNITAIVLLGKYAFRCLDDYVKQKKEGKDPVYRKSVNPEIADETPCWDD